MAPVPQTFGGETSLQGVTFGIEADGALLDALERLSTEVGGYALRVPAARERSTTRRR